MKDDRPSVSEISAAFAAITFTYLVVRLPLLDKPIVYYDDGQTLYHTFALLRGLVPYREHTNHHFMGYILPYVMTAKLIGFSIHLVTIVQVLSQILTGLGFYLCARFFAAKTPAIFITLLVVTAREPWVLGLQPFYQTNVLMVWVWYLSFRLVRREARPALYEAATAGFLCGLAAISDQRTLAFILVPLMAAFVGPSRPRLGARWTALLAGFLIPVASATIYLATNGTWADFVEQTFVFPTRFRSGSQGLFEALKQGLWVHRYLATVTPVLFLLALPGLAALFLRRASVDAKIGACAVLAVAPIGFVGGRDYDYYTIPHLPVLGLLAAFAVVSMRGSTRRAVSAIAGVSVGITIFTALRLDANFRRGPVPDVAGNFVENVRPLISPEDTLLVWGYRMDLYPRLGKLAPIRTASNMFFHPDHQVEGRENRLKHIFPKFQDAFLTFLAKSPPTWIVVFTQTPPGRSYSPAEEAVMSLLERSYERAATVSGPNLAGHLMTFELYKRTHGGTQQ